MSHKEFKFNKLGRIVFLIVCDFIALILSLLLAHSPLYSITNIKIDFDLTIVILLIFLFKIIVFYLFGLYNIIVKYIGFVEVLKVFFAVFSTNIILYFFSKLANIDMPSDVIFISLIPFEFILVLIPRFFYRFRKYIKTYFSFKKANTVKALIVGAGSGGKKALEEIKQNYDQHYSVAGFVDDDKFKVGKFISGTQIIGTLDDIEKIVEEKAIKEVIIAIKNISNDRYNDLIERVSKLNVIIKKLNLISEVNDDTEAKIIHFNIEDLLDRKVIDLENNGIYEFISGETVLVTGGGGSIGSELCRQIARYEPKELIIFDIYENNAYDIQMELERLLFKKTLKPFKLTVLIGSVYNKTRLKEVFETYKPTIVFHAAAYKHVPLMENSSREAVRTNIIGTKYLANICNEYRVKKFVLVSSDKAVRPTNIMGASKRFAEMIINDENKKNITKFSAVRFGNVLGSNGSVIPLFKKQIEDGGPITITDENITRYFMTIKEAVALILQSAVYADGGEIFVLDMGEPVKIIDLARKMIKISKSITGKDIPIEVVGLRPGEKLFEELLIDGDNEKHLSTEHPKIFIERQEKLVEDLQIENIIEKFEYLENDEIKKLISEIVDTYQINGH